MLYPIFDELVSLKSKASRLVLATNRMTSSLSTGDRSSPFRGQGLEFEEVRQYAPGDDIRNIDWRVTARTGAPHTKVFREERDRSIILCVDVNATMRFGTRGTFKSIQAARVAALLGWQANMNHDKLGACLFGDVSHRVLFFHPQRSRKSLWAMFKQLSNKAINAEAPVVSLEDMLTSANQSVPTGGLVYIISDFSGVTEGFKQQVRKLRKRCDIVFIPIDDPADQYIPPLGFLSFLTASHDKISIDTDDDAGRQAYAAQWLKSRQTLQKIATELSINMVPIATNSDVFSTLFLGLKQAQKRGAKK